MADIIGRKDLLGGGIQKFYHFSDMKDFEII